MMKRLGDGSRIDHEARGNQDAHRNEQYQVEDEDDLADSEEAGEGVWLLAQQARERTGGHCTIKPCPGKVDQSFLEEDFSVRFFVLHCGILDAIGHVETRTCPCEERPEQGS